MGIEDGEIVEALADLMERERVTPTWEVAYDPVLRRSHRCYGSNRCSEPVPLRVMMVDCLTDCLEAELARRREKA